MILVAGLAVAGLVGIAAAFYFSIRSGSRRDRRIRAAGAGRVGVGRNPGSRNDTARPSRTAARRVAGGSAQAWPKDPWPDDAWPDHPAAEDAWEDPAAANAWPEDPAAVDAWPEHPAAVGSRAGSRPAARLSREAHAAEISATVDKPRRRVGFRKGADLDEELWPTETFGGVSDEQFWDDLASDKPLTTTARTAQPEPAATRMAKPAPTATRAAKPEAATTRLAKPEAATTRLAKPEPAAARAAQRETATRIQSTYAAPQPVPSMNPQETAVTQPSKGRRRRPSSSEEDPLTSAAFALRPSGPVDGRSALRARDTSGDRYGAGPDPASADSYSSTSPYATPSYGDASSASQTMNTPPSGENYGYGNGHGSHGAHAAPADEPRRPTTRSYQGSHQATGSHRATSGYSGTGSYRTGSYQGTGSYPADGAYPGNGYSVNGHQPGGYQGNGYRGSGNGHRAPYDPRDDYRRLTHQH